jgi:hypothetical protein
MTARREVKIGKKRASANFDVLFKPVASSTQLPANLADLQYSFRSYLKTATAIRNYPMEEALRRVIALNKLTLSNQPISDRLIYSR